jgi:hypothetical protein
VEVEMGERLVERKEWDFGIKNAEGEIEVRRMTSDTFEPEVEVDKGDFIRQAVPTIVRRPRYKKPVRSDSVTLAFGDAQIPFHDENALQLALRAVQEIKPDNVVLTGDMLDLMSLSKYPDASRQEWAGRMQESLDRYHLFLAEIRNRHVGRLAVVHGNHEDRLPKFLRKDAAELMGIRRANAEHELGVLTIQYLARYGDLDIESVTGYPNGRLWLEDNLQVLHGTVAQKGGASAAAYLRNEEASSIFGHDHRLQVAWRTIPTRTGYTQRVAASPGCLANIDGTVPGHNFTTDESNEVVRRAEDWQNGVLLVQHNPRNHDVTPLRISEQGIHIGDKYYGNE